MKVVKNGALISAALFMCLSLAASCKKGAILDNVDLSSPQVAAAQAQAQTAISGMAEIIIENALKSGALMGSAQAVTFGTCPIVTFTPANNGTGFPATLKIDFGTGCTTQGGMYAVGTMTLNVTNRLTQSGAQISGTFSNFKFGSVSLSGSMALTMQGTSPTAYQQINIKATDIAAQVATASVSFKTLDMTRTQIAGMSSLPSPSSNGTWIQDDVYETLITNAEGSASGGKIDGTVSFTAKTEINLRKAYTCSYPDTGAIVVTMGKITGYINFGNGACDNKATVKIGNQPEDEIELPSKP